MVPTCYNLTGGNKYLEQGYSQPDIVLAGLIDILHPELLTGRALKWKEKLNKMKKRKG